MREPIVFLRLFAWDFSSSFMGSGATAWAISSSDASKLTWLGLSDVGADGAFCSASEGGGGKGAAFVSPIRRRVKVSWAFVGIPFRRELVK